MLVCIDESGSIGSGGGRYFVITAVLIDNPKRVKNLVRHFCSRKGIQEIKGSQLHFPERQELLNKLNSKNDYAVVYIVLDKQHFKRKDMLGQNVLFNYLAGHICEYILKNDREYTLCFDNRTVKTDSKYSLSDYLKAKTLEWDVAANFDAHFCESKSHRGIQIADLISNTIFQSYATNKKHFYKQLKIVKSIRFPYQHFGK